MVKTDLSSTTGPVEAQGGALMGDERATFCALYETQLLVYDPLESHASAGGWKFVGASYDRDSGDAKLWVNGTVVQTLNIGAGLDLATQDPVRMGVKTGDGRYFKGRIAQMQVYNKALCEEQIQTIQRRTHVVGKS